MCPSRDHGFVQQVISDALEEPLDMVWKQKTRPVTVLHDNVQGYSWWSEKIVIDHVAFRKMFLFLAWI